MKVRKKITNKKHQYTMIQDLNFPNKRVIRVHTEKDKNQNLNCNKTIKGNLEKLIK